MTLSPAPSTSLFTTDKTSCATGVAKPLFCNTSMHSFFGAQFLPDPPHHPSALVRFLLRRSILRISSPLIPCTPPYLNRQRRNRNVDQCVLFLDCPSLLYCLAIHHPDSKHFLKPEFQIFYFKFQRVEYNLETRLKGLNHLAACKR